jgi:hypothetical protein
LRNRNKKLWKNKKNCRTTIRRYKKWSIYRWGFWKCKNSNNIYNRLYTRWARYTT